MDYSGPPNPTGYVPDSMLPPAFSQISPPKKLRSWRAVLTLFLLAALIPESIATYNSPPLLLLSKPITLVFICAFYGSIALLVRELIYRRQLGRDSILLLGMAAGAINEGIIAGTWYKVQYTGYTMIGGVNPAVAVGLTVFHTFYSTILPILLVNLIFPRLASQSWLGRKSSAFFLVLLALTTLAGVAQTSDRSLRILVLAGVVVLIVIALALPRRRAHVISSKPVPGLMGLRWRGALGTVLFFVIFAIIPGIIGSRIAPAKLSQWQMFPIVLMGGYFWLVIGLARNWRSRAGWGNRQTLALITGALLPAILFSLVLPVAWQGLEPLVTLPMLVLLIWLDRRAKRLEAPGLVG